MTLCQTMPSDDLLRPRRSAKVLTPAWFEMVSHPVRDAFVRCVLQRQKRFPGVCAGRQSGKTEESCRCLVLSLPIKKPWPDPRYFFAADTATKAYGLAFEKCLGLIPKRWIKGDPLKSKGWMEIQTIFGSSLRFGGLTGCEWVEGLPWDGGVADEACDCPPRAWDISIPFALSVRKGWCIRMGAAKRTGVGREAFRDWLKRVERGELPDCAAFTWTSASVMDQIDPEIVKTMARVMDARDFNEQANAVWETLGGRAMWAFDPQINMRPCSYDPNLPMIVGQDFNVDPMAWTLGHVRGDVIEWFDEVHVRDSNTPKTLDILWGRYSQHRGGFRFYPDAASKQRKTSAHQSDYAWILADKRFIGSSGGARVFVPNANPPIVDRFAACNAMWKNAAGESRMFIDPRCVHALDDINNQVLDVEDKNTGHCNAGIGYAVWSIFGLAMQRKVASVPSMHITGR